MPNMKFGVVTNKSVTPQTRDLLAMNKGSGHVTHCHRSKFGHKPWPTDSGRDTM